jgi:O-acetyl-ADP-ribose deacetylase (regulator of RNase III)
VPCGVYHYPLDEAAHIALTAADRHEQLDICFYLFNQQTYDIWQSVYDSLAG